MFTVLKVRDRITPGTEAGWYENPRGTVAHPADGEPSPRTEGHSHDHGHSN